MKKLNIISGIEGLIFGLGILFIPSFIAGAFTPPGDARLLGVYWLLNVVIFAFLLPKFIQDSELQGKQLVPFILWNGFGFALAVLVFILSVYAAVQSWRAVL